MPVPRLAIVAALALVALVACDNGSPRDAGAFCERLRAERDLLVSGVASEADVAATQKAFRELGRLAPAEIADDWDELTLLVERAGEARNDAAERTALARQAAAALPAASAVAEWTKNICGVELPLASLPTSVPTTGPGTVTTKAP
ncbi:MAG TPA: hypothetical protein VF855_01250 [Acidimicrobiales bacterium]